MAESVLDLILRIRKSGSGGKEAAKEFDTLKKSVGGAVKSITGFDLASVTAAAGIAAVGAAAVGAVKETLAWAGAIDKLSHNTGLSTEEASKLAIVAGDVGIEIGTLEKSLKELNKDGLELNFETLKKVSKQYNATTDPVKRLKIATDAFGKSAMDMTELLTRTPEELDALGESAQRSGRIMSGEAVAAAEKFETSLKKLQDSGKGLQVTFGNAVIPTLDEALNSFSNINKGLQAVIITTLLHTGAITQEQAAMRLQAAAAGDVYAAYQQQIPVASELADSNDRGAEAASKLAYEQQLLDVQTAALTSTWQSYVPTVSEAFVANEKYKAAVEPLIGAVSDLAFGMGELTTAVIFNTAAQGLDADAALALAKAMGLVDEKTLAVKDALDAAREKFDENRDGMIDAAEAANGYADAVLRISGVIQDAITQQQQLNALANAMPGGAGGGIVAGGSGGFAGGADFIVPPGFPNDSYPMRVESGERVQVTPANQTTNHYWGGVTANVANGSGLPDALREMGRKADTRSRI